ncbi:MAG TPA: M61 family peptidase [Terriglobales bacterium]|nr:M61 family peptidase [Terriglobales bacterium]
MSLPRCRALVAVIAALIFSLPSLAQPKAPSITLAVDATEAPRKIFHARMTIPASPGTLTLYYPKWIPGEHAPDGPIVDTAGLKFTGNGQTLNWRRDLTDMFTIHVEVPAGVTSVEASLDYLSPAGERGFSGAASATARMTVVSWNQVLLYPKGWPADQITYTASLRLPEGWKFGSALPVASHSGSEVQFKPVSLYTLVDSPVIAGEYLKVVPLSPAGEYPPHEMDIAADSAAALDAPPEVWQQYRNLVEQAYALFGARHYRDYHFLYSLSNHVAHFGLEHHESDDSRVGEDGLVNPSERKLVAGLLPHEYVHSWNGKYRRPADLTTPDYEQPMVTTMLWVYEGLTSYLGDVLTARSSLWTAQEFREELAMTGAMLDHRPGRIWRNLQDTDDFAPVLYFGSPQWASWRRGVDFYPEGVLDWLWADVIIRQQTHNQKSLNDFCKLFYAGPTPQANQAPMVKPYTFDELVSTLNQIAPYDWRGFWHERLTTHAAHAPLGGIEGSGWRVVYTDTPSEMSKLSEQDRKAINAEYSVGLALRDDGTIVDTVHGGLAANAGIGPGMKVIAVNSRQFTPEVWHDALKATKTANGPLQLLIENTDYFTTYSLNYHGGEMYPHLEREANQPDLLSDIIKALPAK